MQVERSDKGEICVIPVRTGESHVELERRLSSCGMRVHVSRMNERGQLLVRVLVEKVNQESAEQVRHVLNAQGCEVQEA